MVQTTRRTDNLFTKAIVSQGAADPFVLGSISNTEGTVLGRWRGRIAPVSAVALSEPARVMLQGRETADADAWIDVDEFIYPANVTVPTGLTITNAPGIGATTIAVDADPTGAFDYGGDCLIQDVATPANSEFFKVGNRTTGPDEIIVPSGLVAAKTNSDKVWNLADLWDRDNFESCTLRDVRVIVFHPAATGPDLMVESHLSIADSLV